MITDEEKSVALLHDVIEDSDFSENDLLNEGIPKSVVDAVVALTKIENENYESYLERVKKNKLATKIKISDIEDNINILRLESLNEWDLKRVAKYHKAWNFLYGN